MVFNVVVEDANTVIGEHLITIRVELANGPYLLDGGGLSFGRGVDSMASPVASVPEFLDANPHGFNEPRKSLFLGVSGAGVDTEEVGRLKILPK